MGLQVELLLVIAMVISCCGNIEARYSEIFNVFNGLGHSTVAREEQLRATGELCEMCEQYSTQALSYLNQNETQIEVLSLLHKTCSKLPPLRQQCITLVDYYVPLFFVEIATTNPEEFCEKMHPCKETIAKETTAIELPTSGNACKLCHRAVSEILTKLQDPITQVDIIAVVLKACTEVENNFPKCNKLVLHYAPEVINSAQAFLKRTNICASVCKADVTATKFIFTS